MNNKMIKGSVAGATGIVLLMGGFGTYALWSDSTSIDADQVQSGNLDISLVTDDANGWTDASTDTVTGTAWSPADDYMVPGDVVKLTQKFQIDAEGKNLELDFTVDDIDPADDTGADWDSLDVSMKLNGNDLATVGDGHFTAATANGEHTLVVTFAFPTSTSDSVDEDKMLDLSDVGINVTQHRPGDTSGH